MFNYPLMLEMLVCKRRMGFSSTRFIFLATDAYACPRPSVREPLLPQQSSQCGKRLSQSREGVQKGVALLLSFQAICRSPSARDSAFFLSFFLELETLWMEAPKISCLRKIGQSGSLP